MVGRIHFKPKKDKIVETILYLAHKGLDLSQYKLVKLFYLADREHLRRFGRPITFDYYVAMEHGPVASIAYDIAKGNIVRGVDPDTLPFTIRRLDRFRFVENPKREINRSLFSKSDLMILDEIVKKYALPKACLPDSAQLSCPHSPEPTIRGLPVQQRSRAMTMTVRDADCPRTVP